MNETKSTEEMNVVEIDYHKGLLRLLAFALSNAGLAVVFCILWVWQYHIDPTLSDQIDDIVVPVVWFGSFFAASYLCMRGPISKVTVISLMCAFFFSFFCGSRLS
jgi:hypothetical protein